MDSDGNGIYEETIITTIPNTPSDFDHVMVYLNGAFQSNVTKGTQAYSATGLSPDTAYTIGTRTVGTNGLVNATWVNQTASTDPDSDLDNLPPDADFIANTTSGTAPLSVQFTDQSTGTNTAYAWDFADDGIIDSTAKNASYTYSSAGIYTVNHTVTGPGGSDTEVKRTYITVTGVPDGNPTPSVPFPGRAPAAPFPDGNPTPSVPFFEDRPLIDRFTDQLIRGYQSVLMRLQQ